MAVAAQASVLQSFPFRAAVVALCVLLLPPLFPATEGLAGGQALLAKAWELLHLLLVGIAVSYGLFSRRNDAADRRVAADEKDAAAAKQAPDARYVSQMLFDDDVPPDSPAAAAADVRSWSAMHRANDPVVVVADGGGGRSHAARAHAQQQQTQPLSLPVRALRPQPGQGDSGDGAPRVRRSSRVDDTAGADHETVLPSPIPWRSRSGRFDVASPSPSPTRLSPASSLSNETLTDDNAAKHRNRSPYKSSSLSSPPPAPPPPPPPFLVHGYHPVPAERRTAAKSFKEELEDHSKKGRRDHHLSFSSTTSPAKPRNSTIDASSSFSSSSSSSSSSYSVGRSVRTIRAREASAAAAAQGQSQEQPDDGGAGDEAQGLHGSDEPYGYRAYQSIPRFQYERGSDPILGKVTVSSESSDDDDDDGELSTRASSPRTPEVDENEVDKKAEEFIARFREQIRLQRIESIKKSAGPRGVKHGK